MAYLIANGPGHALVVERIFGGEPVWANRRLYPDRTVMTWPTREAAEAALRGLVLFSTRRGPSERVDPISEGLVVEKR